MYSDIIVYMLPAEFKYKTLPEKQVAFKRNYF